MTYDDSCDRPHPSEPETLGQEGDGVCPRHAGPRIGGCVTWSGYEGRDDLEIACNPTQGTYVPRQTELSHACVTRGLSQSGQYR